jgi:hypothetical protein
MIFLDIFVTGITIILLFCINSNLFETAFATSSYDDPKILEPKAQPIPITNSSTLKPPVPPQPTPMAPKPPVPPQPTPIIFSSAPTPPAPHTISITELQSIRDEQPTYEFVRGRG